MEYELPGVPQVPVNEKVGLTFANALRALLRQDPDIMLVGEIRDQETADIATHAALTGHLVLSTLHTNDAATALTRLVDLGIEPYLVASTVEAVLAQRLVRRICDSCKEQVELTPEQRTALGPGAAELAQVWAGRGVLRVPGHRIPGPDRDLRAPGHGRRAANGRPAERQRQPPGEAGGGPGHAPPQGRRNPSHPGGVTTPEEVLRVANV